MEENTNALNELHKGACMGVDALSYVLDKVEDNDFKKVLKEQYKDYEKIAKDIEDMYSKYDDGNPDKTNFMNKTMTWTSVEMKTMTDQSNSKIAELLLTGVNMGIIEGRRILNNKNLNKEVNDIANSYVTMQENNYDKLKNYL